MANLDWNERTPGGRFASRRSLIGINANKHELVCATIGGALASAAGIFYVLTIRYLHPDDLGMSFGLAALGVGLVARPRFLVLDITVLSFVLFGLREILRYVGTGPTRFAWHDLLIGIVLVAVAIRLGRSEKEANKRGSDHDYRRDSVVTAIRGNPVHAPVSFRLEGGQMGIVTGGNGSGKTSLLRAMLAELEIRSGRIEVFGQTVRFGRTWQLTRSSIRMIPQFPVLPDGMTIAEYVGAWHRYRPPACRRELNDVLREVEKLTAQSRRLLLGRLSHGQKRVIEILLAFSARPEQSLRTNRSLASPNK